MRGEEREHLHFCAQDAKRRLATSSQQQIHHGISIFTYWRVEVVGIGGGGVYTNLYIVVCVVCSLLMRAFNIF